jgi:hypothetical protein
VKDRSRARGNLKKELFKSTMTWRVFVKAMRFLNIPKFELVVRLHHHNNTITEHHMVVALDVFKDDDTLETSEDPSHDE